MKALRYLIIAVIAIIVLMAGSILIATMILDPNEFKPKIEEAAENATNLDLILDGEISWSLFPLGLELNKVEARLEDKRLVSLERLEARVGFWSLVTLSPAVHTFALEGLDAHLTMNEAGQGNWERIMPDSGKAAEETPETAQTTPEPETEPASEGGQPLSFSVEEVLISDGRVNYTDEGTGQNLTVEDVNVSAREIELGSFFPLDLGFRFATNQPDLTINGQIAAELSASESLKQFQVRNLDSDFDLTGAPFGGKTVTAGVDGKAISADLENETASLQELAASFANLSLSSNLTVEGFGASPKLGGNLDLEQFSIRKLMDQMGLAPIETSDPDVLKKAAFSTQIGGEPGVIRLSELALTLDDTDFNGSAGVTLENTGIQLALQGTSLNVDRYLPPKPEETEEKAAQSDDSKTSEPSSQASSEDSELLPLETIRALALDIDLGLEKLVASNLTVTNIKSIIKANNGLVRVEPFAADLYDGNINVQARLDARKNNPTWKITKKVGNVQLLPLLTDLSEVTMLSGGANLNGDIRTRGNSIAALRENAKGTIDFNIADGAFREMNLTRMACRGIAMANQESLSTTDWGAHTPFNDMSGRFRIDGHTLTNNNLTAALAGMKLEGKGTVDAKALALDYKAGLRVVGELHRDEACRVTEYVRGAVIPVECKGDLAGDPAKLCSFDGSRFRDTLKGMAKQAAKQKAKEEIDRAKDKARDKAKEKLQEKLGDEAGKQLKDKLEGLF